MNARVEPQLLTPLSNRHLDALEEDEALVEALGEPLVRTHVAVARAQAAMAKELAPEEVAATAAMLY